MGPVCLGTNFLGDHQLRYSSDTIMHYSSIITTHAGLNSLVNTLDNRADEHPTTGTGKLLLKPRSESMLSTISPPLNAPSWAVDASFQLHDLPSPHLPPQTLNPLADGELDETSRRPSVQSGRQLISAEEILENL